MEGVTGRFDNLEVLLDELGKDIRQEKVDKSAFEKLMKQFVKVEKIVMEPLMRKKQEDDELIHSVMGSTNEELNGNIDPTDLVKVRKTKSLMKNPIGFKEKNKRTINLLPSQLQHFQNLNHT